jgi:hypothetical protein
VGSEEEKKDQLTTKEKITMPTCIPEVFKIVDGTPVATTNGGITCDYISLKDALRVTIIAELLQAVSHATALGVNQATAVDGSDAEAVTEVQQVWKNADVSASDTLVRGTDAATIAATAGANDQLLIMQFDPATLDDGFDCIAATLSNSSQSTNYATITYLIETRYPQATPPSAIED